MPNQRLVIRYDYSPPLPQKDNSFFCFFLLLFSDFSFVLPDLFIICLLFCLLGWGRKKPPRSELPSIISTMVQEKRPAPI